MAVIGHKVRQVKEVISLGRSPRLLVVSCMKNMQTVEIEITRINPDHFGTWITGTYGDLWFQAKIFDEGSEYGIKEGRVSKLFVREDGKTVCEYDRGWSIKPCGILAGLCEDIRCFLEEAPVEA